MVSVTDSKILKVQLATVALQQPLSKDHRVQVIYIGNAKGGVPQLLRKRLEQAQMTAHLGKKTLLN